MLIVKVNATSSFHFVAFSLTVQLLHLVCLAQQGNRFPGLASPWGEAIAFTLTNFSCILYSLHVSAKKEDDYVKTSGSQ